MVVKLKKPVVFLIFRCYNLKDPVFPFRYKWLTVEQKVSDLHKHKGVAIPAYLANFPVHPGK
jgi:hypothetical protein